MSNRASIGISVFPTLLNWGAYVLVIGFSIFACLGYRFVESPADLLARGVAYANLGRLKEGKVAFERVLERDSGLIRARYDLGLIALIEKRNADAERAFLAVLKEDPKYLEAGVSLGGLWVDQGRYVEAKALMLPLLKEHPGDQRLLRNLKIAELRSAANLAGHEKPAGH